jgi:hypothetical protein
MNELTDDIKRKESISLDEYNVSEENEIDRFISQEEASLDVQDYFNKVNNLTDYEQKQIKKDNEDLVHNLITDIRSEIGMNEAQEKPSDILKNIDAEKSQVVGSNEEPKPKGPKKTLPAYAPPHFHVPYTSFRYLSKFSDSSNPVLKAYGNGFKIGADLIGSTLEGAENFVKAFPKKYEALKNDFNNHDVKDHFNELKQMSLSASRYSSGDFVTDKGIDIPKVAGNMVGFAAPVIGTGILAGKAAAGLGLGYLGTTAAVGASEFALGAVLTTKDSGSLFNFLEDMDWIDREIATKIPFYVTKDDSEIMASLKGGSENLLLFMAPILGLAGFKGGQSVYKNRQAIQKTVTDTIQKTGDLVKEGLVTRHLKAAPNLVEDYARVAKKGLYNKSEFLDFVMKDYMTKEINKKTFMGYLFDDEGSIFIGGKNNKGLKAADEAVSEVAENIDGVTGKQINDFKDGLKVNNLEKVSVSYDLLKGNKLITKSTKSKLNKSIEFLKDHKKAMDKMKYSEPGTYKAIQDIVNDDATSARITTQEISDGTFLAKMSKHDSDIHDLYLKVKESGFHKDNIEELVEIFPKTKAEKVSDVQVTKRAQDFLDTYGYKGSAQDLTKNQIRDLVEVTAITQVIQEKALKQAADIGRKLNNFAMDPKDIASRREYQALTIAAHRSRLALEQITSQTNKIKHDLGAAFRLLQPKIRQKVQSKIVEFADKDLLDEKSQMILMDQFVQLDETKLRNWYKKLDDVTRMMEKDKIGAREAYNKLLRKNTLINAVENVGQFFYNNFLANLSTQTSATFGLSLTSTIDIAQDAIIKNIMRSTYYGTGVIPNKKDSLMVLSVLKQLDAHKASSTSLLAQSKFLTNFRKPDGTLKTGKQIYKESFITGRSIIDKGSEKYGLGYSRLISKKDKADLIATAPFEKPADIFQEMLRDTFVEEATHVSKNTDFFGSKSSSLKHNVVNKFADLHSLPLRFLQASDEFVKSKRLYSKYHQIVSEKVSKRFANLSEEKLIKLRKDKSKFDKYVKDLYKKELNNVDNFTDAKISAREVTFQNKYNDGVTPDFAITGVPSLPISASLKWLKNPLISTLHPFARISVNMSDWMTQYTPGLGLLNAKIADDLKAGGYRRAQAITKQTTGLLLASTGYYLAEKGIITGGYSSNKKFRSDQKRFGHPIYSFNIGDEVSIPLQRIEPLGAFFSTMADLRNKIVESHNKGDFDSVEKGMGALIGMAKIAGHLFLPSVVQDFHDFLGVPFSSKDLTPKEKVRKTANVMNNLATRSFPKFLFFQSKWFNEDIKRQTTEYDKDGVSVFKSLRNYLYNTEYGLLYDKAINLLPDEAAKDYHINLGEPELDDFGRELNRHGIPKELMENYSDQGFIDLVHSPVFSGSTFKQRKINPDPVYKELRKLNKNFVENFKSGIYSSEDLRELNEPEKYLESIQILPDIPRTVQIRNSFGAGISYRLDNKEYNDLKKFINYNNGYYNLVKDQIDYAKYQELKDEEIALRLYQVSREYVSELVKGYLVDNHIKFTNKANEVTKQTVK